MKMLVVGETIHLNNHKLNQIDVVECLFKIGIDLINSDIIGEIGDGINHFLIYGMMILDGDKEV
jgi:hypothetical protein